MEIVLLLFLILGVTVGGIKIAQNHNKIDRWLCIKTPWRFRLWWCALWVRKDPFHPSLDSDLETLSKKINWERKKLILKTNIRAVLGCRHSASAKRNLADNLTSLTKRLQEEYYASQSARRDIVRKRDPENRLQQSPSQ